jgi:pimeloyl-ACP methyl ester carboxylesterase
MTITYKGVPIHYTDKGQGEALVLLHGFLSNCSMWEPFIPALTKTHRVICIDILGHGKTLCTGYTHTIEEMAAAVYAVINALHISSITIVGHSMGGYVGCAFAKAYVKTINALCLINSTPLPDTSERKLMRERVHIMATKNYAPLVRMSFTKLFTSEIKEKHSVEISRGLKEALKTSVQGYRAANSGMRLRQDYSELWKDGAFKKGLILGIEDWIIDSKLHKALFKKQSDYFKIIPGGHMSHISQKVNIQSHIRTFLQEV